MDSALSDAASAMDAAFRDLVDAKTSPASEAEVGERLAVFKASAARLEEALGRDQEAGKAAAFSTEEEAGLAAKLEGKLRVIDRARDLAGDWDNRLETIIKSKESALQNVSTSFSSTPPSPSRKQRFSDRSSSRQV